MAEHRTWYFDKKTGIPWYYEPKTGQWHYLLGRKEQILPYLDSLANEDVMRRPEQTAPGVGYFDPKTRTYGEVPNISTVAAQDSSARERMLDRMRLRREQGRWLFYPGREPTEPVGFPVPPMSGGYSWDPSGADADYYQYQMDVKSNPWETLIHPVDGDYPEWELRGLEKYMGGSLSPPTEEIAQRAGIQPETLQMFRRFHTEKEIRLQLLEALVAHPQTVPARESQALKLAKGQALLQQIAPPSAAPSRELRGMRATEPPERSQALKMQMLLQQMRLDRPPDRIAPKPSHKPWWAPRPTGREWS